VATSRMKLYILGTNTYTSLIVWYISGLTCGYYVTYGD